jgi:predicted nuclease with RNAse H fold
MLPASPPAPSAPGEILVVAGELSGAMAVARQAAKRMRIDPAAILVVGPTVGGTGLHSSRRLTGAADAQKRAARLHAADVPHVVVVDAPLDSENSRWVRTIVEALRATAVWAVVDATRKTADVARQLRGFGLVDAIAVHGVTATGDPASVLSLGVPVASLDGRRATPQAWAALLCDRLDHADD